MWRTSKAQDSLLPILTLMMLPVPTEQRCTTIHGIIYAIFTKGVSMFLIFNLLVLSLALKKSRLGSLALRKWFH